MRKRVSRVAVASAALFREKPVDFELPKLHHTSFKGALDEIEILGFLLCDVFTLVDADAFYFITAKQLPQYHGKHVELLC